MPAVGSFVGIYLNFEFSQTTDKSVESWNHVFDALGTQAEFFNQTNATFASTPNRLHAFRRSVGLARFERAIR